MGGRGAGVADRFISVQERCDLGGRRKAGEEVAEDGCVFDLARGRGEDTIRTVRRIEYGMGSRVNGRWDWLDMGEIETENVYSRPWQIPVLGMAAQK